jgi:hypothetical protein
VWPDPWRWIRDDPDDRISARPGYFAQTVLPFLRDAAVASLLLRQRHGTEDGLGSEVAEFASIKARRSSVESIRAIAMLGFMLGGPRSS